MKQQYHGLEVAVIGLACRMPDADNIDQFWNNLTEGKESVRFLSDDELANLNVSREQLNDKRFVKCAGGELEGKNEFDAEFFGVKHAEAMVMDPQTRIFLEASYHALEDAGYAHGREQSVGVYAAAKSSFFWQAKSFFTEEFKSLGGFAVSTLANRDFLSTTVSYKLNLKGPSLVLHTTCSSSLVSIHQACQALNGGECKMALAGGINIIALENKGYIHQEGMIYSADGHCRPFDGNASGTVEGQGVGVVLLKPLDDAIRDNDNIYAVIKGSAVNNDGNLKLGFTAPSIQGQQKVIEMAHLIAEVDPETISYIEAHGTGTDIGDPIEIEALKLAFKSNKKNFCGIGAVKANIGHLDAAAGVAGFIKTVLSLYHRKMLPATNFESPNPKIDFDNSPFYVNTGFKNWESDQPLRAGVSSFGMGGTNAHLILEEPPVREGSMESEKPELLILSAMTEASLQQGFEKLKNFMANKAENVSLSDVSYTLQTGRRAMPYRWAAVCKPTELLDHMSFEGIKASRNIRKVFMFPGQGNQYKRMGYGLYLTQPFFKAEMDKCFDLLLEYTSRDFRQMLFEDNDIDVNATELAQPLLFSIEYALARLLMSWGIIPDAMAGHSIGEYAAACIAGVFDLPTALRIVSTRGKLMQMMPHGSMISVAIPENKARNIAGDLVDVAVLNSKDSTVLAGDDTAIEACIKKMESAGVQVIKLHTSHAFHSRMMEPMLDTFLGEISNSRFQKPTIPFISNFTGRWITAEEAQSPQYWVNQLRNTVRFADGLELMVKDQYTHFIEVGPGASLSYFATQIAGKSISTYNTVRHPNRNVDDTLFLSESLGKMWVHGVDIDWVKYNIGENAVKVPLPGYSFEKQKYWIEDEVFANNFMQSTAVQRKPIADWFYAPSFRQIVDINPVSHAGTASYIAFVDHDVVSSIQNDARAIIVEQGDRTEKLSERHYVLNIQAKEDFKVFFESLASIPASIIYQWSLSGEDNGIKETFEMPLWCIQSLASIQGRDAITINFVVNSIYQLSGAENTNPYLSLLQGLVKVVPQEIIDLSIKLIDIDKPVDARLFAELTDTVYKEDTILYRNKLKWSLDWDNLNLSMPNVKGGIRKNGTYLVTGGSGKIATLITQYLLDEYQAHIILVSRTENDKFINNERVRQIKGSVTDTALLDQQVNIIEKEIGQLNGVFHTAGVTDTLAVEQIDQPSKLPHFDTKIEGTRVLSHLISNREVDFVLLTSSLASILGGLGYAAYAAANCFQDTFAGNHSESKTRWISVNFDGWNFGELQSDRDVIRPEEGLEVIERILATPHLNRIAVSTTDLKQRMQQWVNRSKNSIKEPVKSTPRHQRPRPELSVAYVAPESSNEKCLADIMNKYFYYDKIGVNDSFFDLGGDSLMALSILSKIHEQLKVRLSIKSFYEAPTIKGLVGAIDLSVKERYLRVKAAEKKEFYPLSSIQKRIYYAASIDKNSVNYNLTSLYHITDDLAEATIQNIFDKIVNRHEILRTSFRIIGKQPVQVVEHLQSITIEKYDEEVTKGDLLQRNRPIIRRFVRPFDLSEAPLIRVGLIQMNNGEKLLMLDFHHIVSDAVSGSILLNEILQLFANVDLAPVQLHYKDFSEWHNCMLGSKILKMQKQYWLERFSGENPYLQIPADLTRPEVQNYKVDSLYFIIDPKVYKRIHEISSEAGAGVFIFMLTAANILFHKYTGHNNIVVGTETAGRPHADIQDTMGMFVGLLPLKNQVEAGDTFVELLTKVRENTLQDFDNQLYQFNDLVKDLGIKGKIDRNPLFNIVVSYDNISTTFSESAHESGKGLNATKLEFAQSESIWDFRLGVIDTQSDIVIRIDYASDIYRKDTADMLGKRWVDIIKKVVENPNIKVSEIAMASSLKKANANTQLIEELDFDF